MRRATDATGHKIATQPTKPQGFIIRPPLLTSNKKKYYLRVSSKVWQVLNKCYSLRESYE
jgi:hypothetical protein